MMARFKTIWQSINASYWFLPAVFSLLALAAATATLWLDRNGWSDVVSQTSWLQPARPDGAISRDGRVMGSYVHGLLASTPLREALLRQIGGLSTGADYDRTVEDALDEIAALLESHCDVDAMIALATGA